MQLSHDGKRNPAAKKGIEKFLIFLAQNLFLFEPIAKEYLVSWKRIYQIYKRKGDFYVCNYGLISFLPLLNIHKDWRILKQIA